MKKIATLLFITISTFLIGITAAFLYLKLDNSNKQKLETLPNTKILDEITETSEIPTLIFCELSSDPKEYNGKIVRLNATLSLSQEGRWFYDQNCKTSQGGISPYVANLEMWKPIQEARKQKDSNSKANELDMTVIGKFKIEDSKDSFIIVPFQFEILQIEKVFKSNKENSQNY